VIHVHYFYAPRMRIIGYFDENDSGSTARAAGPRRPCGHGASLRLPRWLDSAAQAEGPSYEFPDHVFKFHLSLRESQAGLAGSTGPRSRYVRRQHRDSRPGGHGRTRDTRADSEGRLGVGPADAPGRMIIMTTARLACQSVADGTVAPWHPGRAAPSGCQHGGPCQVQVVLEDTGPMARTPTGPESVSDGQPWPRPG
jgi:hypothetical protein